ncbi:hypothetical protein KUCAC02_019663 [Chaenocephalus aceratus]|uniref:Uncharacterized protein n=1 Tax=Chaenocephalus aceratus TaxID=36190 RepID=A0ACB9VPT9_CHAAC|nr:hypothetical protein KUCAC02_019663 [Chaenocephalus aceratus]
MQTTILQMFKRKERDEETQNVLKIRKATPTDDTVEAQREEEETQPEEVVAGPSEATTDEKELLKKIIETKRKITVLANESTSVGHKSTLIVFLKASVDGDMEPIAFPLDLSPKNMRQLSECAHNLDIALRRIGKVFSVR